MKQKEHICNYIYSYNRCFYSAKCCRNTYNMSLPQGLHGRGNLEISENVKHDFQAYKKWTLKLPFLKNCPLITNDWKSLGKLMEVHYLESMETSLPELESSSCGCKIFLDHINVVWISAKGSRDKSTVYYFYKSSISQAVFRPHRFSVSQISVSVH